MSSAIPPPLPPLEAPAKGAVKHTPRRAPAVLVALVGMLFLSWLSEMQMTPGNSPPPQESSNSLRKRLLADKTTGPLFQILQRKEPKLFEQAVETIQEGFHSGASDEQLSESIQALIGTRLLRRQGYLPDPDLMAAAHHFIALMRQYSITSPTTYIEMLQSKPVGDVRPYITRELRDDGLRLLQKLVGVTPYAVELPPVSEINATIHKAVMALRPKYGEKLHLADLTQPRTAGEMRTSCDINADLFDYIVSLPPTEAVGFFRAYYLDPTGQREKAAVSNAKK